MIAKYRYPRASVDPEIRFIIWKTVVLDPKMLFPILKGFLDVGSVIGSNKL